MISNFSVGIPKHLRPKGHMEFLRGYQKSPVEPMSLLMSLLREHLQWSMDCPWGINPQPTKIRGGFHGKQSMEKWERGQIVNQCFQKLWKISASGIAHLQVFNQDGILNPLGFQEGFDWLDTDSRNSHINRQGRGRGVDPEIQLKRERKTDLVWGRHPANSSGRALEMLISPKSNGSCREKPWNALFSVASPQPCISSCDKLNKITNTKRLESVSDRKSVV